MHLFRVGDRLPGICETCECQVTAVMRYTDYTPEGADYSVPDVLIGLCEVCGDVVAIPPQSTPKINEAGRAAGTAAGVEAEAEVATVAARVPRVLEDALGLAAANYGGRSSEFRAIALRYYLDQVACDPCVAGEVRISSESGLARGKADRRLILKISPLRWKSAKEAAKAAGIAKDSSLLRGVAALIAEDCRIALRGEAESPSPKPSRGAKARLAFLKGLAAAL